MVRLASALALAGALVAIGTAALPLRASAHAALVESAPANGELLDVAPEEIRLVFTEPPDVTLTTIEVVDRSGAPVSSGEARPVAGDDHAVRAGLDPLPDGVFTVSWRTVSTVDGHVTSGSFSFGVGVSPGEVAPVPEGEVETPAPTALAVAGRWALYVGLAVLFGGALVGLLVFGARAVARPWILAPAWGLAAIGVVVMTLEERAAVGVPLSTLLDSEPGAALIRLGVAVVVAGVAAVAVALRPGTTTLLLLAAASAAAISIRATGGHAAPSTLQEVLQGVHFAAAGAWIGGLAWLVVGAWRGLTAERARHFSNVAAAGLVALLITGLLRATDELGGPGWWLHAFDTDYGTTLVIKLSIVAPLVALGALNRFRHVRRFEQLGSPPLLRTVAAELVLAAGVFAMTGILTGLPPQGGEASTPPSAPEPLVVTGSDFATTTRVRLEISPGTVGPNAFVADVTDYDSGEPVEARRVTLSFALPDRPEVGSELELERGEEGAWQAAGTALSIEGTWQVQVLVEGPTGSVEVPLEVTPTPPEQRVEVSRAEGQPDLYTFSLEDGLTVQTYVDPGAAGRTNQVHVTAFDASGAELPLASAVLTVASPHGDPFEPELIRGGAGHFIANIELHEGTWRFQASMEAEDGRVLSVAWDQDFA
jgi:copper transport protein